MYVSVLKIVLLLLLWFYINQIEHRSNLTWNHGATKYQVQVHAQRCKITLRYWERKRILCKQIWIVDFKEEKFWQPRKNCFKLSPTCLKHVSYIRGHFYNLGIVKFFNVLKGPLIFIGYKVNRHSFTTEPSTTSDSKEKKNVSY